MLCYIYREFLYLSNESKLHKVEKDKKTFFFTISRAFFGQNDPDK